MQNQLIILFTGVIAVATVIYTVVTVALLLTTSRSVAVTRQALLLNALVHEAELSFRFSERHPDGSKRFSDSDISHYTVQIVRLREELQEHP